MFASMRHGIAFRAGTVLLRRERWRSAAFLLGHATRLAPDHWESHNNLAVAFLKLERWSDAVSAAQRAVSVDPRAVDSHDFLGIALLQMERCDEAMAAYQRALALDPGRYDLYDRMGMVLTRLERWDDVVGVYEAALKLDASRYGAHQRLGIALQRLGRWDAAVAAFRRAIELASNTPAAAGDLAGLRHSLENAEARRDGASDSLTMEERAAARVAQHAAAFWTEANLGPDVFAIERWLEALTAVPDPAHVTPGPRLLFVLDNDFGELATVKYFVLGQEFAGRTTLLLPPKLYVHNVDAIPGRTHQYGSVDEILQWVDRERADIVFLLSGYMLWEHLGFSQEDLRRLLHELRQRECRVVTADPYLGMLSKQDPRTLIRIDLPTTHSAFADQLAKAGRAAEERMWTAFAQAEQLLRDAYHLYPSFCDVAEDDLAETDARNIAVFNDRLIRPARRAQANVSPHWLFILGTPDCDVQALLEGNAFFEIVAKKLLEARAAGRHPILIGPRAFVEQLLLRMPSTDGIDILSQCPFTRFYSLLLSAEHAFYWNIVSHSLLIRLFNELPIIQFDLGHLVRVAPPIQERIVRWYYQGWQPPLRDHREPLTIETVEAWVAEYRQQASRLVKRYRRAPSPNQMIADLMRRPVRATLPHHEEAHERR